MSDAYDHLPEHLRPPEDVPERQIPTPPKALSDFQDIESPQDLLHVLKTRWNEGITPHLDELRARLFLSLGSWGLTVGGMYFLAKPVIYHFQQLAPKDTGFVQLHPLDSLLVVFQIMLTLGTLLALPVMLFHLLRFLLPAMMQKERQLLLPALLLGTLGGLGGLAFGSELVLPLSLKMLLGLTNELATPQIGIKAYIEFCVMMCSLMAVTFQVPMLAFLLGKIGLLKRSLLVRFWRESGVGIVLLAAVLTPTQDPLTLGLVAGSMMILYGLCILIVGD